MDSVDLKVHEIIRDVLGIEENAITNHAQFLDDLGVDSLDFYEMISVIEKTFHIAIADEDYDKLKTVGGLIDYVNSKADVKKLKLLEPEIKYKERDKQASI